MKKIQIIFSGLLITLFFSSSIQAQSLNFDQKMRAIRAIDSLIYNYQLLGKFISPGSDTISDASLDQFRSIFSPDADIWDEYTPEFYYIDSSITPFHLSDRSLDLYLANIKKYYNRGIDQLSISNLAININNFENNVVYVIVEKNFRATSSKNKTIITNKDTLMLTVTLIEDFTKAIITRISNNGAKFDLKRENILNDKDHDFVMDSEDKFPNIPGLIRFHGAPSPRGYLLSFNINGGVSKSIISFKKDALTNESTGLRTYDIRDIGNIEPSSTGIEYHVAGEFELFVGNKRHFGVGLGALYTHSQQKLELSKFHVEYDAIDAVSINGVENHYRRIITGLGTGGKSKLSETVTYNMLSIPFFVKYKINFKNSGGDTTLLKSYLKLSIGLAYTIPIDFSTVYDAAFNYEGVYNKENPNDAASKLVFGEATNNSIRINQKFIEDYLASGKDINNIAWATSQFGLGIETPNKTKTINIEPSWKNLTFIFKPQYSRTLSERLSLNIGAVFLFQSIDIPIGNTNNYLLTDTKDGEYNSIVNSLGRINFFTGGVNVGLSIGIFR